MTKELEMTLQQINPKNPTEEAILDDLRTGISPTILMEDIREDPDAYSYTEDDLEVALFEWKIPY